MSSFGSGLPIVAPAPAAPVVGPQVSNPIVVLPVPGPPGPGGANITVTVVAGETLSGHRAVVLHTDGLAYYASNDDPADATRQVWLTLGAAIEGTDVQLQPLGIVTEPSWAWVDGPIFLSSGGVLTQTPPVAPAFLMQLAQPTGSTEIMFNPRTPIAL